MATARLHATLTSACPTGWRDARMNREMVEIIRNQKPLTLPPSATVQDACRHMHERKVGAVLVTNPRGELEGIFTGRDVVRIAAEGKNFTSTHLRQVMTKTP